MRVLRKSVSTLLSLIMAFGVFAVTPVNSASAAVVEAAPCGSAVTITAADYVSLRVDDPGDYILTGTASMYNFDIYVDCSSSAANDGDTIVLLSDMPDPQNLLTFNKTLTLELNGHQFRVSRLSIEENGDLTVIDTADQPSASGLTLAQLDTAEGGRFTMNSGVLTNAANIPLRFVNSGTVLIAGTAVLQPGNGSGFSASTSTGTIEISGGAAATTVTIGAGAELTIEGESIDGLDFEPENPEEECLERSTDEGKTKIKNLKMHPVTVDTGITAMDALSSADALPDGLKTIWDDYNQNTSSLIKIAPPVLQALSYTDIKFIFPYPEGWFFPTLYLPDVLSPGSHFAGFFKDASWGTYGIPYVGEAVVENLEIGALWIPCEAAIIKADGSREYYLAFNEAAAAANGNIVEILSAPVKNYTLKKTTDDPAIYETLKLKRGSYLGSCVNAPGGLPDGYALRSWTYQSDGEEITCYHRALSALRCPPSLSPSTLFSQATPIRSRLPKIWSTAR